MISLAAMLVAASGEFYQTVAAAVFGVTLILLYLSSTLYHVVSSPRPKRVLQTIDHSCIYLLIAGSYTPIALVSLRGPWGWSLLAVVWLLALGGVALKAFSSKKKSGKLSTALYLAMGWLAVVALKPMLATIASGGVVWIVAGGLCYTLGIIFFAWKNLHFNHAIWHLFVLAGSLCHVVATTFFIFST